MFTEFKEFIKRGNMLDLAVAVILGAAFGKIINTLVEGVIMPPIGLLLGKIDFSSLFYPLTNEQVASLAEAKQKGVPVIAYGQFINDIINFLIIGFAVFLIVRTVNRMKGAEEKNPTTKECPRCLSKIPLKATRCAECCVELEAA